MSGTSTGILIMRQLSVDELTRKLADLRKPGFLQPSLQLYIYMYVYMHPYTNVPTILSYRIIPTRPSPELRKTYDINDGCKDHIPVLF